MGILNNIGVGVVEDMKAWCKSVGIRYYTIVDDKICVEGDVNLLRFEGDELPYPFGFINGNFNISGSNIKTLENCPENVVNFFCNWCKSLESLEGSPQKILGNYYCDNCESLKFLKGWPHTLNGSYAYYGCPNLEDSEIFKYGIQKSTEVHI